MLLIYDFAIRLFTFGIHIAALFNPKARLWVKGREPSTVHREPYTVHREPFTVNRAPSTVPRPPAPVLWVHAASLGEFEQGRPVIEAFREKYPDWKIVLTFFSPSGYEVRKDYPHADLVCYLPADTRQNARDFLDQIRPDVAIFIKYEFWANYLFELKKRGVTTLLVSALFRPSQPFFKWYGGFWRKMLGCFTHIFVQNEVSEKLLQSVDIQNVTVGGDTRVDRVLKIAEGVQENEVVKTFVSGRGEPVLVAGSTWEADEALIFAAATNWKRIIAPHEPSESNVLRICKLAGDAQRYSQWDVLTDGLNRSNTLVIDNIGLLNTLYRYGTVAYIGGGFGKGIHNTLEPAAFGLPIIFGPKYEKFEEARQFVARGAAFSVQNAKELALILTQLQDPSFYQKASEAVRGYLAESRGATAKVMRFLGEKFVK
jgi:3-deoxy-D-manno-octulosonic-acid transferase